MLNSKIYFLLRPGESGNEFCSDIISYLKNLNNTCYLTKTSPWKIESDRRLNRDIKILPYLISYHDKDNLSIGSLQLLCGCDRVSVIFNPLDTYKKTWNKEIPFLFISFCRFIKSFKPRSIDRIILLFS